MIHNSQVFQDSGNWFPGADPQVGTLDPDPLCWKPFVEEETKSSKDFVSGMHLLGASGDPATKNGLAIYVYLFQQSMTNSYMYNTNGDFLLGP
jgi:homogentisate 1,2-dioxygenase